MNRLRIVFLLFGVYFVALLGRLFFWQVVRGEDFARQARIQQQSGSTLLAPRGNILSKDLTWLSASVESWLVFANKNETDKGSRELANILAPFFVEDSSNHDLLLQEASRLEGLLEDKDTVWIALKQKVSADVKKNIQALSLSGIGFEKRETRAYPEASAAAHLLGFVGKDDEGADKGYFGLEGYYDLSLSGKNGFLERESDARGAPILFGDSKEILAVGGADLVTHIDKTVQMIVEDKLKLGLEKYGAVSGNAVVLDPADGSILAMASFPSYDPAKYFDFGNEFFKNPIISDSFEPGSIFKPIIMASGLDAGVVKPDTICDICHGPYKVDKYQIETWDKKYYKDSTMTDVILHSDNVGMTFVGNKLGAEKLYDYLSDFGFGQLTGVDLQGEASPHLRERGTWNVVDLATATFGQGVAITPIQMVRAIATIANKGVSTTPQVVDRVKGGGWEDDIKPEVGKRVISEKASAEITDMMIEAVKRGEAKWAVPKGFRVAGKTGTAQIPVSGHYDEEKTNASFVGFAPPENPKFVMLVTLREPQSSQWASETAAPLWFDIARELFPYLGISPEN